MRKICRRLKKKEKGTPEMNEWCCRMWEDYVFRCSSYWFNQYSQAFFILISVVNKIHG